jgi:hypothetical protein
MNERVLARLEPRIWLALLLLIAILAPRSQAHTRSTDVTWLKDIAPIVRARCANCHGAGGSPPTLLAYGDAQTNARAIRATVLENRMPPWPAARGFGDFANDRSLTALEVELLTAWVDGNAPLGRPDAAPPPSTDPTATPGDRPRTIRIPAGHPSRSVESFQLDTASPGELWVSGWGFQPGNAELIDRVSVTIDGGEMLGSWSAGDPLVRYPSGIANRIPRGAPLAIDIHYRKSMVSDSPPSELQLLLSTRPRYAIHHRLLGCRTTTLPRSIDALAITPSTSGGESFEATARRSDASVEPLLVIPEFDPATHLTYRLRRPLRLAAGSRIDVRSSSPDCGATLEFIERESRQVIARPQ